MVEEDSDPAVVTAVILRETREADAERAAQAIPSRVETQVTAPPALAVQEVAPRKEESVSAAHTGLTQIVVAAAIVVVLFFLWVAERRGRRLEDADGG